MGSISQERIGLSRAARVSHRIVVGTVVDQSLFRFPGSPEYAAQPEGKALKVLRLRVLRTLKGPDLAAGAELRVFSAQEWFHHTHAAVIEAGVISYSDARYSGGVPADQIRPGMDLLVFLWDEPAPPGFPPGSVFMGIGGAHDRADREAEVVAALREGASAGFDHYVRLALNERVRFPDQLELVVLAHSHKRPMVGGPGKEWIDLELSREGQTHSLSLSHCSDPDGSETWDTKVWGAYSIEAKAMSTEDATLVVRKSGPA